MTTSPNRIAIALKPLSRILQIFGVLPFKFNQNHEIEGMNFDSRPFYSVHDIILLAIICGYNLLYIYTQLDAYWLIIIHVGYMFSRIAKIIVWNIRRWTCKEVLKNVWRRLTINEASFFKYGVEFNVSYVPWCGFVIIITSVMLKLLFFALILYEGNHKQNSTRPNFMLVGIASLVDFPTIVTTAEYITYFLILREYFKKIGTTFTKMITRNFLVQDKNDSQYVQMISLAYFSICDVCNKTTEVLWPTVLIGMVDSLMVSTVHAHNLISKIYAGRITEYWFFDYKYSVIILTQQMLTFVPMVFVTNILIKSVSMISTNVLDQNYQNK